MLPSEITSAPPELRHAQNGTSGPSAANWLRRGLPHVLLAVGVVIAFVLSTKAALRVGYLAYWILLEAAYFAPAYRRHLQLDTLKFRAKIQFQTILKIFTHVGAITACGLVFDYLWGNALLPENLPQGVTAHDVIGRRALNFLLLTMALAPTISQWRLYRLQRAGYNLIEIAKGSYRQLTVTIPASGQAVEAALALRMQQLQFDKAPRLTRMFFETRPRVRQSSTNKTAIELTWPFCPTAVDLSVGRVEHGTSVQLQCRLRSGFYHLEIFVAPREATTLLNFLRTNLVDATDSEMRLANALRKQDEFRHLAVEAQLRMLQTQIEPHFLFNTLANVQQMYRENLNEGEAMLNHLTAYFRGAVEGFRCERSTIAKEMELSERYLAIMKARMGDRLLFQFDTMEGIRHHPLPPAMLISLVENAIKHGIAPNTGGTIEVNATQVENVVRLEVSDDGAGFSSVGGTGTGLTNLRDRLDALYGPRAWLEIDAGESGGFKASIVIPFEGLV